MKLSELENKEVTIDGAYVEAKAWGNHEGYGYIKLHFVKEEREPPKRLSF